MNQRRDHYRTRKAPVTTVNLPKVVASAGAPDSVRGVQPAGGPTTLSRALASPSHFKRVKTFNNGSLGSGIDEERSEMR